jgi:hypothetical protein
MKSKSLLHLFSSCGLLVIFASLSANAATAPHWECQNKDLEITCTADKCSQSEAFTPLQLTVQPQGQQAHLQVCAYSGCWAGRAQRFANGSHLFFSGQQLAWQGMGQNPADFVLVLDRRDHIALLKGAGFALPLTCTRGAAGTD